MYEKHLRREFPVAFIVAVLIIAGIILSIRSPKAPEPNQPTISEPVLTLPGVDVYEFNTPGQMHCVLAVDKASKFNRTPALSCIKIVDLKPDPRRWQKSLPTPEQGA